MSSDDQIRLDPLVKRGAFFKIGILKHIFIHIVTCKSVLVGILVSAAQYFLSVCLEFYSCAVSGMSGERMKDQGIFFPYNGNLKGKLSVHRNGVVPQAGKIIVVRMLQQISKGFRTPDFRSIGISEKVKAGHVIVVVMGTDTGVNLLNPIFPEQEWEGIEPGPPGASVRSGGAPCHKVIAQVQYQGFFAFRNQHIGIGHAGTVEQQMRSQRLIGSFPQQKQSGIMSAEG